MIFEYTEVISDRQQRRSVGEVSQSSDHRSCGSAKGAASCEEALDLPTLFGVFDRIVVP